MATYTGTTDIALTRTHTLPREYFTSAVLFQEEMDAIFAERWLCAVRESALARPGDYVLRDVAGESILIVRDDAGAIHAFFNVCRHRGTRLCEAASGSVGDAIRCPYHAWTYALDGRLLGAPSAAEIPGFDRAAYPLHRAAATTWDGFVFIALGAAPRPFAEVFAPVFHRFDRFCLSALVAAETIEYDVRANWKIILQNYSECYHCAPVHPELARITPPTSGQNDLCEGPFLGGYMLLNEGTQSMTLSGRACGVPVGDLSSSDRRRVYYYSLFPNMLLSLHPDYVMAHTLWPVDAGRTRITCQWLFHPDSVAAGAWDPHDGVAFWDRTNRQDWHICEQSQLGVSSRRYTPGPYSRRESLSAAIDQEVLAALGRGGNA